MMQLSRPFNTVILKLQQKVEPQPIPHMAQNNGSQVAAKVEPQHTAPMMQQDVNNSWTKTIKVSQASPHRRWQKSQRTQANLKCTQETTQQPTDQEKQPANIPWKRTNPLITSKSVGKPLIQNICGTVGLNDCCNPQFHEFGATVLRAQVLVFF